MLKDRAPRYAFISTVGVYRDWPKEPADEAAPLFDCAPTAGPDDGDYGTLKAGCERAVVEDYGDRALLLRPGIILGPHENVGRGPWWLRRIAEGGQVLAPGDPDTPIQEVDARDLAIFTLDGLERGLGGPYNVVSRPGHTTFGGWLQACVDATGSGAELVWAPDDVLRDAGVQEWFELPLWMAQDEAPHRWHVDVERAHRDGLHCRPIEDTVRDTWAWLQEGGPLPPPRPGMATHGMRHGIDPDKEQRILATLLAARS
jgi:2'-hydroxyisoflavone reductase